MPRGFLARASIVTAVLALVAIAHSALAVTWVTWVPKQTSAGTTATFGNYWGGATFMYSTQSVTWITPPMNTLGTATFNQIQNYKGAQNAALWVVFSSQSTSSGYLYQGTVAATATVGIGSSYAFSTNLYSTAAFAVIYVPSETCGQLYFHADVQNSYVTTFTFYGTYMFGNSTWFYTTFYSASVAPNTWFNPAVPGPNTCLSPGYYLYVATIYSTGLAIKIVGTAQVSIGTTSEGTSYVPGTQYALNIAPASSDSMVFPWTTSASPYVELMFTQNVTNTAGSSTAGSFNVAVSGNTFSVSNAYWLLYFSDSATNTFPSGQVTPTNCPSGVFELPTTTSSSVTKVLSCQSLASPSSGVAVYSGDYAKYSSAATTFIPFLIPSSAATSISFTASYTDSAGNTYSTSITTSQLAVFISSYSITPSVSGYVDYVHNPSITAGNTYYIPVPSTGWAYVGPEYLTSQSISGATNVTVSLYALPSITAYPTVTLNTTALRMPFSSSTTSYTIAFYQVSGDTETIGITPNTFANTNLLINTTSYTIPSTATTATLYVPVASGNTYFYGQLPQLWGSPYKTKIGIALLGKPGVSNYPTLTLNTTARFPFSSSATSYTFYFAVNPGDTETLGVTPNGLGVYFLSSNITTYTIPSMPHNSTLTIPTTTGVYIGQSLGDWWNVTNKPYYNLTLVNGTGNTGSFTITVNGVSNTASQFAWNLNNPPNAIVYFTGTDGYTYAFNPSWVQSMGIAQALVGSSIYFVPTVVGETLTSTNLAFISQGVWLNETTVSNSFMTYYPLPSFINFLNTPIYMYVNGSTSPRYLVPALAIINNNLQQYTVQYMNVTAWSNVGSLMGVAIIQTPFRFIGFVSNGSLAPIWVLLNSTVGVPPILFSYYPQIRYLLMPSTASTQYTLVQIYVNVPSQLFNQWSGNLVFGVSQAMQNGYYALVSGGFYAPPPTQFSLYVPTYLLNKLAQLFLASYPKSTTCTMVQVLSNPLETTICQGVSQVVNINLGNTQVGKPAFGDVPGAFNIAPLVRNLTPEQIIAINAAAAALVILFVKKHQSLPAGLMLGGAVCLAIGIFLWLAMEIGIGILLLVAGAALAATHRTQ